MASKKQLKKAMDNLIFDALDECYSIQLYQPAKKEESDRVIDEIVEFRNDIINKIYKSKQKAEFKEIIQKIEEKSEEFFDTINQMY
ncbi:MAG: hypothetical protein HYU67_07845 [Flavobacteriia bacterium]|nr:hypothetical protein [Flavobacteriia bacterium]